jgi:hypothetical protein
MKIPRNNKKFTLENDSDLILNGNLKNMIQTLRIVQMTKTIFSYHFTKTIFRYGYYEQNPSRSPKSTPSCPIEIGVRTMIGLLISDVDLSMCRRFMGVPGSR